eukprot:2668_1
MAYQTQINILIRIIINMCNRWYNYISNNLEKENPFKYEEQPYKEQPKEYIQPPPYTEQPEKEYIPYKEPNVYESPKQPPYKAPSKEYNLYNQPAKEYNEISNRFGYVHAPPLNNDNRFQIFDYQPQGEPRIYEEETPGIINMQQQKRIEGYEGKPQPTPIPTPVPKPSVIDIATSSDDFTILVTALKQEECIDP